MLLIYNPHYSSWDKIILIFFYTHQNFLWWTINIVIIVFIDLILIVQSYVFLFNPYYNLFYLLESKCDKTNARKKSFFRGQFDANRDNDKSTSSGDPKGISGNTELVMARSLRGPLRAERDHRWLPRQVSAAPALLPGRLTNPPLQQPDEFPFGPWLVLFINLGFGPDLSPWMRIAGGNQASSVAVISSFTTRCWILTLSNRFQVITGWTDCRENLTKLHQSKNMLQHKWRWMYR